MVYGVKQFVCLYACLLQNLTPIFSGLAEQKGLKIQNISDIFAPLAAKPILSSVVNHLSCNKDLEVNLYFSVTFLCTHSKLQFRLKLQFKISKNILTLHPGPHWYQAHLLPIELSWLGWGYEICHTNFTST